MKVYGGIDVDSKQLSLVLIDENGMLYKYIQVKADPKEDWTDRIQDIADKFESSWMSCLTEEDIALISVEEPVMIQNPKTTMMLSEIDALVCRWLYLMGVNHLRVSNLMWKRDLFGGNTRISKTDTRNWVLENYPDSGSLKSEHYYDSVAIACWCKEHGEKEYSLRNAKKVSKLRKDMGTKKRTKKRKM